MDSIPLLISRYLDGELSDEEVIRLAAVLETDVGSIDRLVFSSFIHAQLLNWMDQQGEHVGEGAAAVDAHDLLDSTATQAAAPVGEVNRVPSTHTQPLLNRARRRFLSFGALAATLLIVASVATVAYVIASRPEYVGQLTDATGCTWSASHAGMGAGTFLEQGQDLELITGSAVITFTSGAKVFLEGPTRLRLNSPGEIRLIEGRIAAKVPRQAVGFTVTSSLARFVDLGTEFELTLRAEKSFELHVYAGLVELQLDERFGEAVHQPVRKAQAQAVSFDIQTGDIAPLHFKEGKTMPF